MKKFDWSAWRAGKVGLAEFIDSVTCSPEESHKYGPGEVSVKSPNKDALWGYDFTLKTKSQGEDEF